MSRALPLSPTYTLSAPTLCLFPHHCIYAAPMPPTHTLAGRARRGQHHARLHTVRARRDPLPPLRPARNPALRQPPRHTDRLPERPRASLRTPVAPGGRGGGGGAAGCGVEAGQLLGSCLAGEAAGRGAAVAAHRVQVCGRFGVGGVLMVWGMRRRVPIALLGLGGWLRLGSPVVGRAGISSSDGCLPAAPAFARLQMRE